MTKICTTIEQSKKLLELGVDVNTADMWYQHIGYSITDGKEKPTYFPMVIRDNISDDDIPAWSLSALLELIPSTVFLYSKLVKWDGSYYIEHREMLYDNPIDAAFEMIVWLKENNKL